MSQTNVRSRRSRIAVLALGVAALALALPFSAQADGKHHGKRHGNNGRSHYYGGSSYYGPPHGHYGGHKHCRGPKHVEVYSYYPAVAVPVAPPAYAYPAYPDYPVRYDGKPVVRIGVDWILDF